MDAFFASVEQRDNPDLRGKPVAVGGGGPRGVVAAASYEARAFGVFSAMPGATARRLCPELIFVRHRFDVYKSVSRQIRAIFREYTDLVEPLSLDEAYLDVTQNKQNEASAIRIAQEIRARIKSETGLTASAGVSFNKFLAKTASGLKKPDGISVILPEQAEAFIASLPVEKFFGIGKKTAEKLKKRGIFTGADLRKIERLDLAKWFGKSGLYYYRIVRGEDNRKVEPNRVRKSISVENTFEHDAATPEELMPFLDELVDNLGRNMHRMGISGKTVTLKIKFHNFRISTRSRTVSHPIEDVESLRELAHYLIYHPVWPPEPVRLLGVGLSKLNTEETEADSGQMRLDFG
jgi:DNA polymerase-4